MHTAACRVRSDAPGGGGGKPRRSNADRAAGRGRRDGGERPRGGRGRDARERSGSCRTGRGRSHPHAGAHARGDRPQRRRVPRGDRGADRGGDRRGPGAAGGLSESSEGRPAGKPMPEGDRRLGHRSPGSAGELRGGAATGLCLPPTPGS